MACSDCYPGNSTVIRSGENVSVTGSGTPSDPFVVSASPGDTGDRMFATDIEPDPNLYLLNIQRPMLIRATLTANAVLTLPNGFGAGAAGSIVLVLTQGPGGSKTINFASAGVRSSTPITLSTTVGAVDVITLLWTGDFWVATSVQKNVV